MLSQYMRLYTQANSNPDTGPLVDVSLSNQDGTGINANFEYLYIGQHYPFVNLYLLMQAMNGPLQVNETIIEVTPYNAIGPVNQVQSISFSPLPSQGTFKLTYGLLSTISLAFNCTAANVQTALRSLSGLGAITVTGDFTAGFTITMIGVPAPTMLSITTIDNLLKTDIYSQLQVEYWNGLVWQFGVDPLDASNGLKKNGMFQWGIRNNYNWCETWQTDDVDQSCPPILRGLFVNNCYWMRLSWVKTGIFTKPNPVTMISRICYSFTTTEYINSIDIEAKSYYHSVGKSTGVTNKSDWIPEIIFASQEMVHDLKRIGLVKSAGQIIEFDEVYLACAWKTLAHIYFNMGKGYNEHREIVTRKYELALASQALTLDTNRNGKIERRELNATATRMSR